LREVSIRISRLAEVGAAVFEGGERRLDRNVAGKTQIRRHGRPLFAVSSGDF